MAAKSHSTFGASQRKRSNRTAMADAAEAKMQEFLRLHQAQLAGAQVPQHLWPIVYYKLQYVSLNAPPLFTND